MADWLINGLTATISGVLTVFLVLIVIAFLISQLKHIENMGFKKKEREAARRQFQATSDRNQSIAKKSERNAVDELELVAVITAAVADSMNTTVDQLVVRSIKRVEQHTRRW